MTTFQLAEANGRWQEETTVVQEKSAWLVIRIGRQFFAVPVEGVQGVLRQWQASPIPLAPPEVVGTMNLRGRIVTLLDTGQYLGQGVRHAADWNMGVVVEKQGFLYCFLVDEVGDVMQLPTDRIEPCPGNLGGRLCDYATGVFRLERTLLIMLDITRILDDEPEALP